MGEGWCRHKYYLNGCLQAHKMGEIYVFPSKTFNFELFQEIHASTGLLMWVNLLVHKHYVQQDTRSNYFWFAGLCCPEEDVQSAIMFILVYLFESNWEDHLSPRQLTQLCEDLICVLNTAKTQILMMNSLGKYQCFILLIHVMQMLHLHDYGGGGRDKCFSI
jgi:hypothetical protein